MSAKGDRNSLCDGAYELRKLDEDRDCEFLERFDCGNEDLNEYFQHDALLSRNELIGQICCLVYKATADLEIPVALIDFSNDSVRKKSSNRTPGYQDIPEFDLDNNKRYPTLPGVKITRLGVLNEFRGRNVGTQLINMVKQFFVSENRTGCRFLTVDAYNDPDVLSFYEKNNFSFFYDKDSGNKTRSMYFDLKRFSIAEACSGGSQDLEVAIER